MFTKLYISHIVSCNWSQTLKFEHIITRSNPYTAQFWTSPYVNHNIEKHQVILAIIIQKHVFSILYLVGIKHVIRCVLHCRAMFQQYYLKRLLPKTNISECSAHWLGRPCLLPVTRVRIPLTQYTSFFSPNLALLYEIV